MVEMVAVVAFGMVMLIPIYVCGIILSTAHVERWGKLGEITLYCIYNELQ